MSVPFVPVIVVAILGAVAVADRRLKTAAQPLRLQLAETPTSSPRSFVSTWPRIGCEEEKDCPKTSIFINEINLICLVQPSAQKYFSSVFQKIMFLSPHPDSTGGAARDRHGRWDEDAVAVRVFSARMCADENVFTGDKSVWS
ncbi:MAG TPA: hypothetical protein VKR55_05900 [Bradyrhizobium sp.]|uniref:hypothetical protein n=1 Tax=Bradyrhizobium sp. TaxID=376 RepID=UPI002B922E90|nr:hypothetical protein [Bradyrhizobium sp.]HLZ01674.1 hypothetical protein [Bradyrhizobium sp.]